MFTFWDPDMWEKGVKEFSVMYADLENKEAGAAAAFLGMGAGVSGVVVGGGLQVLWPARVA